MKSFLAALTLKLWADIGTTSTPNIEIRMP
jgi:hypothetical protein